MTKKYIKHLIFIGLMIILSIVLSIISLKDNKVSATKLVNTYNIPLEITNTLENSELTRGVYIFTDNFVDGSNYLVVCGGDLYKDGYDVDIVKIDEHEFINNLRYVHITEKHVNSNLSYCKNSKNPYVIFNLGNCSLIKDMFIEFDVYSLSSETNMKVLQWWGNNQTEKKYSDYEYKMITNKNEIEELSWNKIDNFNFNNNEINYILSPRFYDDTIVNTYAYPHHNFGVEAMYIIFPVNVQGELNDVQLEDVCRINKKGSSSYVFNIYYKRVNNPNTKYLTNNIGQNFKVFKVYSEEFKNETYNVGMVNVPLDIKVFQFYEVLKDAQIKDVYKCYLK